MFLGIELGSTRIKAVLINENHSLVASGSHGWENKLENGNWTYNLDDVWRGLKSAVNNLSKNDNVNLGDVKAIGISAMMHGYLAFDKDNNLLTPFRTWRNTTTEQAANFLTKEFNFNIPQRWSIAHLYQAMLNNESHVKDVSFITTLAGYVHWQLTGEKVIGIGDASGVFPIDSTILNYDEKMANQFDALTSSKGFSFKFNNIVPKVLNAGDKAGALTAEGVALLDPTGALKPGTAFCPPEGDAGTGMVATNSVKECTGNISAGTSVFAMIVLEKALSKVYMEIDMVTTPSGKPVAMVHCNNCCSDIDAWVRLFGEALELFGTKVDKNILFEKLYKISGTGNSDCGGVLSYNYYSGEPITGIDEGRPLLVRKPDGDFSLANVMRSLIFSAVGTLKIGMDILAAENVQVKQLLGHGGFFTTPEIGQGVMAAALGAPVTVMDSASEGGAWGIALLAAYMQKKGANESLESYLENHVFAGNKGTTLLPSKSDTNSFNHYMEGYVKGLNIQRSAVENF